MNKYPVLTIIAVVIIAVLAGCSGGNKPAAPVTPEPSVPAATQEYSDPAKTIQTTVGTEFEIMLESNPTTGYTWEGNESYDKDMLTLVKSTYTPSKPQLMGSGGTHQYIFKALKAGDTEITLVNKRSWEKSESDKTFVFKVTVKGN